MSNTIADGWYLMTKRDGHQIMRRFTNGLSNGMAEEPELFEGMGYTFEPAVVMTLAEYNATIARLTQERDSLRAQLEAQGQWEDVPDGQYHINSNVWQVWEGMVGVKPEGRGLVYAAVLPDGWRLLQRRTVGEGEGQP